MSKYELLIKNTTWFEVDVFEDPVMNFQINDLGDLENRHVNYSQSMSAPATPRNCQAFGYSDLHDIDNSYPMTRHECRLYVNGKEIVGAGGVAILYEVSNVFKFQILGNAGLFTLLENAPMSEADIGGIIDWRLDKMNPTTFLDYVKYVYYISVNGAPQSFLTNIAYQLRLPVLMFRKAIESMLENYDYTLNFLNEPTNLDAAALTLQTLKPEAGYMLPFAVEVTGDADYIQNTIPDYAITQEGDILEPVAIVTNQPQFKMHPNADYKVNVLLYDFTAGTVRIIISKVGDQNYLNETFIAEPPLVFAVEVDVPYDTTFDDLRISVTTLSNPATTSYKCRITANVIEDMDKIPVVPLNGKINFRTNIGFSTQLEMFKAFVNLFGLLVQVNEKTKTVNLCTYDYLIQNIPNAQDWSSKVSIDAVPIKSYDLGFAQSNIITMRTNDIDNVTNEGAIQCNNQTLKGETTIIDLPFESGLDFQFINSDPFAKVNQFEYDPENQTYKFVGCTPHVLIVTDETTMVNIQNGATTLATYMWNIAKHFPLAATMNSNFLGLTKILTNPLKVEIPMLLEVEDVELIDQLTPIYLHQFGKYFYLNMVSNYIEGKITNCELIKIQG